MPNPNHRKEDGLPLSEEEEEEEEEEPKNQKKDTEYLKVNAVKESKQEHKQPDALLPQFPFFLVVLAPRKSGKTNMVLDSLLDPAKYKSRFDVIIIWSRTFHHDSKWRNISLPPGSVFTKFDEPDAELLLRFAEEVAKTTYVNALFVVDDMISDNVMHKQHHGFFEALATRGRHANISVIMITQQYMALSPPIRNNATNTCVFRIRNGDELDKLTRENRESLTAEEFLQIYNTATDEPYCFLHINNQQADPKDRFYKNWNKKLQLE